MLFDERLHGIAPGAETGLIWMNEVRHQSRINMALVSEEDVAEIAIEHGLLIGKALHHSVDGMVGVADPIKVLLVPLVSAGVVTAWENFQ